MSADEIERLVVTLSRLPGMGERSANRISVHLLKQKSTAMKNLIRYLVNVHDNAVECEICHNIAMMSPCSICSNQKRDSETLCVVCDISDLWSIERSGFYKGQYHVIGGKLSAINGVRPDDLHTDSLQERIVKQSVKEVIIAMSADLDGQTTMFFINDKIKKLEVKITTLSTGVPIGGELDYLDDGTIIAAFNQRRDLE